MATNLDGFKKDCQKCVEHFKSDLGKLRTGRASSSLIENIEVDYYGARVPVKQMGVITTPEPRLITVQVYDASAVESVEKAIRSADLGLNPARDGSLIRVSIPSLTEDRRKELIKSLNRMAEEARVSLRNHRRDEIDKLKKQEKSKEISTDDLRRGQDEIQKVTDSYTAEVDKILQVKEKEMLEV